MLGPGGPRQRALLPGAVALLLLVPAVPALVPAVDEAPWLAWRVDTVDDSGVSVASTTSTAVDDSGTVHITFDRGGARYVQSTQPGWEFERIDPDGSHPDLALDSDHTPHVAYTKKTTRGEVWYGVRQGGGWVTEQIDPLGISRPQIAIGPDDIVHVLYEKSDGPDDEVRFATRNTDGSWTIETLHHASRFTSDLVIDSTGTPHAVYNLLEDSADLIRYATKDDQGEWVFEFLDDCRFGVGIDVDVLDRPHIVCWGLEGLQYHTHDGQDWIQQTVSDGSNLLPPRASIDTGLEPSIAVDSRLNPHIAFTMRPNVFFPDDPTRRGELHYATKVGGEWFIEVADRDGYHNGIASSIDLDGNDRPHISYTLGWRFSRGSCGDIQNTCFDLRYATPLVGSVAGAVGR